MSTPSPFPQPSSLDARPDLFANAKPGDQVVIDSRTGLASGREVTKIAKVYKVYVTTERQDGYVTKWRRDTGRMMGQTGYSFTYLRPGTPERLAKVRAENRRVLLLGRMKHQTKWDDVPTETLEKIAALLDASAAPASPASPAAEQTAK